MGFTAHICETLSELSDELAVMIGDAPKFEDRTGNFSGMSAENVFSGFEKSLDILRSKLGDERYVQMLALSREARSHFEADPHDNNGRTDQGLDCLLAIDELLNAAWRSQSVD
jgi:hypothetical protein